MYLCCSRQNSNAVVQSIDLQGEAEGGKDTDGEDTGAGNVQAGAGIGSSRGGLAGGRRSLVTAGSRAGGLGSIGARSRASGGCGGRSALRGANA